MTSAEDKRTVPDIISIDPLTLGSYVYSKNEIKLNNLLNFRT